MAHVRKSSPNAGLGDQMKVLSTFKTVKSKCWPWLSDKSPFNLFKYFSCCSEVEAKEMGIKEERFGERDVPSNRERD
jgi:hypothetical protein